MTTSQRVPFKPETWPEDADGDRPRLCSECGTPLMYGSRHRQCAPTEQAKPPFDGEQYVREWADYWRKRALSAEATLAALRAQPVPSMSMFLSRADYESAIEALARGAK